MKKLLALLAFAPLVFAQSTVTYTYGGLPVPIYPNDWNVVSVITLLVPRSLMVSKVTATVQAQYSGVGDLNVYLYSANGTRSKLLERNCGSLQNINTTFDDSAPTMFSASCPTATGGSYKGNEPLSNSNGQNSYGYWRLAVENNGSGNTGVLTGFSVTITGVTQGPPTIGPNSIVTTSSLENGIIAPGDQLSIYGISMGPTAGATADITKPLPTSLGGTQVTFDGVAAPLYYVSDQFIHVQAPMSLTAGKATQIQVVASNGSSLSVPVVVAATNPGFFTEESDGLGQVKALNQDGSVNGDGSSFNSTPAAAGSVVQLFLTGLGAVTPAVAAGTPAPTTPLSTVASGVTAAVNGNAATVNFAGLAPGLIGTYQVNVTIPATTPAGAVRVAVTAGGETTQKGVTVQVK
jgi:uncharacterized protein (TIGR03437 family)